MFNMDTLQYYSDEGGKSSERQMKEQQTLNNSDEAQTDITKQIIRFDAKQSEHRQGIKHLNDNQYSHVKSA